MANHCHSLYPLTKTLWFFAFIICFCNIQGQTIRSVDSLNSAAFDLLFEDAQMAKQVSLQAISEAKKIDYTVAIGRSLSRLGIYYDIHGEYNNAIQCFHAAITILENQKDTSELSFAYNNLGVLHFERKQYDFALDNYNKSLVLDRLRNNKEGIAAGLQNIGVIYTYKDSIEKSISLYDEAEKYYGQTNDENGLASLYSNKAKLLLNQKKFSEALSYYIEIEKIFEKVGATYEQEVSNQISLADANLGIGNEKEALRHAEQALEISEKFDSHTRKIYSYEILHEVYARMGSYKKAYEAMHTYATLQDSLFDVEKDNAVSELQVKYESEKKDKALSTVRLEKDAEISLRKAGENQRNFLIAITVVVIVISAFVFYAYFSKQKINKLLSDKNQIITENLQQKEMLLGEIHHRVKNNLQLISNLLDFQSMELTEEKASDAIQDSKNRVASMAVLHRFLYQQGDFRNVAMKEYITELSQNLEQTFSSQNYPVSFKVDIEPISLDVNYSIPIGLIVNELVTNSFKHAFIKNQPGEISIHLSQHDDKLLLRIGDNGKGANPDDIKTGNFGSRIVSSLLRQLRAEWTIENKNGLTHIVWISKFRKS